MNFTTDHRKNKKLHKLYTQYALETIPVIEEFIQTMMDFSRVNEAIIAGTVNEHYSNLIKNDAAWFEAAALHRAGVSCLEEEA